MAHPEQITSVGTGGQADVLASDGDRDAVAGMLASAFAEGRLTADEHEERLAAAYAARTAGELAGLTADLPGRASEAGGRQLVGVPDDGVDRCLLRALLILCPPAGIAWLLAARRRHRPGPGPAPAQRVWTGADSRGGDW